jgi:hypothetical protein
MDMMMPDNEVSLSNTVSRGNYKINT